jgi:hypothetical protein
MQGVPKPWNGDATRSASVPRRAVVRVYKIESGPTSDDIAKQLGPKVIQGMAAIKDVLADKLPGVEGIKGLYFLPGDQTTPAGTGLIAATTWDDATIVVELQAVFRPRLLCSFALQLPVSGLRSSLTQG